MEFASRLGRFCEANLVGEEKEGDGSCLNSETGSEIARTWPLN